MTYRLLSIAEEELAEAVEYYEAQSPGLGSEFLDEFEAVISRITQFPEGWTRVSARHRRCLFRRFPYAVIYAQVGNGLLVSGVMHLRQDPRKILERLRQT